MVSVAILAGGRATRFGGLDKSALVVDGERILNRQLAMLRSVESVGDADFIVPRADAGYHPLCAEYSRAYREPIARRLDARRLNVIDLVDDVRTRVVTAAELNRFGDCHRLLSNVNTPLDHRALQGSHGHQL
jgi:molybdopterin-guanine dinucleotide biosynthesis protein A